MVGGPTERLHLSDVIRLHLNGATFEKDYFVPYSQCT